MALAFLCKQLKQNGLVDDLDITAFVIDHKAREESAVEAQTVARRLRALDIRTQTLALDWSAFTGPNEKAAFETYARILRFRALGRACAASRVEALLLGHHQDDNVETIFQRLTQRSHLPGLRGMLGNTAIPECLGIYGASEGGSSLHLKRSAEAEAGTPRIRLDVNKREIEPTQKRPIPQSYAASGGVAVCRPFLSCVKANLLATCRENGVAYATDSTNFDPSLTPRNAIRSLLASDDLPRALQPASILSVIAKADAEVNYRRNVCNKLLQQCKILDFNARGGWMLVKFPTASERPKFFQELASTLGGAVKSTQYLASSAVDAQAITLSRISRLISPLPTSKFPLSHYKPFIGRVFFPELGSEKEEQQRRKTFTANGTMFQSYQWRAPISSNAHGHANESTNPAAAAAEGDNGNIWLISRQPYMRRKPPTPRQFNAPAPKSDRETYFTSWQLWDNRFWIKVAVFPAMRRNIRASLSHQDSDPERPPDAEIPDSAPLPPPETPTIPLVVRSLCAADVALACENLDRKPGKGPSHYLVSGESESDDPESEVSSHQSDDVLSEPLSDPDTPTDAALSYKSKFLLRLSHNAPGHLRYTMPVLTVPESDKPGGAKERLVVLPTIGARLGPDWRQDFMFMGERWRMRWQWMFKKVDVETLRLMGWWE
ncbi:PP-loop family [Aspergillus sp. HF37]|nr:PP-loop family [Aspergillus sp. HF37]